MFDPWSQAVLLVAGDKAGNWSSWYAGAISQAERVFADWIIGEAQRREDKEQ
ncbi:hypothetical protein [Plantactinospora sonchi]|uniref:hypothetical protein n=1 Tax=Plantactinospora sonchi TaxID=1544735 RepID=UPI0038B6A37C